MSKLTRIAAIVLATAAVMLSACSKSQDLHSGINFIPDSDSSIVLNQQGSTWSLYVKNVNVSKEVGLDVKTDPAVGQALLTVSQNGTPVDSLPMKFNLQWTGKTVCLNCSKNLHDWTRSEVK